MITAANYTTLRNYESLYSSMIKGKSALELGKEWITWHGIDDLLPSSSRVTIDRRNEGMSDMAGGYTRRKFSINLLACKLI